MYVMRKSCAKWKLRIDKMWNVGNAEVIFDKY